MSRKRRALPRGRSTPSANKIRCDLDVPLIRTGDNRNGSRSDQLTLVRRLNKMGYSIIAFSHTVCGKVNQYDDGFETIPSTITDQINSMDSNKKIKTNAGELKRISQFNTKILRRLNVMIKEKSDLAPFLRVGNSSAGKLQGVLDSYDIIALCPQNDVTFSTVCASNNLINVDIITLDYTAGAGGVQLPYKLKTSDIATATKRGITFELPYGIALVDTNKRKALVQTAKTFINACLGVRDPIPRMILCSGKRTFDKRDFGPAALRGCGVMMNFAKIVLGFPDYVVSKVFSQNAFDAITRGNSRKCGAVYTEKNRSLTEVSLSLTGHDAVELTKESIIHKDDDDEFDRNFCNLKSNNKEEEKHYDFGDDFLSLS